MISVIIPAHDEERVIGRTLDVLLADAPPGELEVVVVCNGCRDRTADVARSFGGAVRVIETATAGKPHALNLGDRAATSYPRAYVDADVDLPFSALRKVAEVLERGDVLVAAPAIELDYDGCPPLVRAYYSCWLRTPYVRGDMVGSGVYVLGERGRRRFGAFPPIIADDLFVHTRFAPHERRSVKDARFVKRPPRSLLTIVRIKSRMFAGHRQLRELDRDSPGPDQSGPAREARSRVHEIARDPRSMLALPVYVAVNLAARARAWHKRRSGLLGAWDRDETSRASSVPR